MSVPKFNEKELRVVAQKQTMFGQIDIYDFPCSVREASESLYKKHEPI